MDANGGRNGCTKAPRLSHLLIGGHADQHISGTADSASNGLKSGKDVLSDA